MDNFLNLITTQGEAIFGSLWTLVWALIRIVIIVLPMFACVAYLTLWERKLIGWMHIRLGPNRACYSSQPGNNCPVPFMNPVIRPDRYRRTDERQFRGRAGAIAVDNIIVILNNTHTYRLSPFTPKRWLMPAEELLQLSPLHSSKSSADKSRQRYA